jgi:hypothetical protein
MEEQIPRFCPKCGLPPDSTKRLQQLVSHDGGMPPTSRIAQQGTCRNNHHWFPSEENTDPDEE